MTEAPLVDRIGAAIRDHRRQVNLTQEDMAAAIGVHQSLVSRWERGREFPSIPQLIAVEEALKLDAGSLFIAAGIVEVGDIEAAIRAADYLSGRERDFLLMALERVIVPPPPPVPTLRQEELVYTIEEAAKALKISRWTLNRMIQEGSLRALKLRDGKRAHVRIPGDELRRLLEGEA
jgi:excisionase family DNA binding protein